MANAKFDPVAQYPDYQPGAGSMLMKSLLAIQAHKDEQARQAQRDAALIAEQQSLANERQNQQEDNALKTNLMFYKMTQDAEEKKALLDATGKVQAEKVKGAAANQAANTQAAADMHGATTQALSDMHAAGTQANADTNAAQTEAASAAAATPEGESAAPTPELPTPTPPPTPPAIPAQPELPHPFQFLYKGKQVSLPIYNHDQMSAIEEDALQKKVHETEALARAKESSVWIVNNPDGTVRTAEPGEPGAHEVAVHPGIAALLRGSPTANLKFENVKIDGKETMATPQMIADAEKAGHTVTAYHKPESDVGQENAFQRSYVHAYDRTSHVADDAQKEFNNTNNLVDLITAANPISDAALVPKFLSAIAGGRGSGLRLTQSEMKSVQSARSTLGGLEATWNKWTTGQTLLPEQRAEMLALAQKSLARNKKLLDAAWKAKAAVSDPTATPASHRAALADLDKAQAALDNPTDTTVPSTGGLHPTTKAGIDDLFSGKQ